MKKLVYKTPSVEVTKWASQDIITTSGLTKNLSGVVAEVGDSNVTAQIDFEKLQ